MFLSFSTHTTMPRRHTTPPCHHTTTARHHATMRLACQRCQSTLTTRAWRLCVGNSLSVSQSPTLDRKDKVKHYIRIKTQNNIALRFWCKSGVWGLICVRLMSYNHIEPQSLNDYNHDHNPYIWNIYKPNSGIRAWFGVTDRITITITKRGHQSDWPHNHNQRGHSYTWKVIYIW